MPQAGKTYKKSTIQMMKINPQKGMIRMTTVVRAMGKVERAVGLSMTMMGGSTSAASASKPT